MDNFKVKINYSNRILNKRFGKLTVIAPSIKRDKWGSLLWMTRCDCGNQILLRKSQLISGNTKSCGCLYKSRKHRNQRNYFDIPRTIKEFRNSQYCWQLPLGLRRRFWKTLTVTEALPQFIKVNPQLKWRILHLPIGEYSISQIKRGIKEGGESYQRLYQLKCFKVRGALNFLEVSEASENRAFISISSLICGGGSMMGQYYISQEKLQKLWIQSLRKAIEGRVEIVNLKEKTQEALLSKIGEELSIYDTEIDNQKLILALKNSRAFNARGMLKNILID